MRRHLTVAAALALGSGLFVVAGGASGAGASTYPPIPPGPIVVGATTPLSGPTAVDGISTEESFNGVTMKAFNAEFPDGIDGHPVKLVFLDDQGTVTGAVQATNQLVSDHVSAVVTLSYNPEATIQQAEILNHAHIPIISDLGYNEFVNPKTYPYFWGVGASDPQEAVATAKWLKASNITKMAVLSDGIQGSNEVLSDLKAVLPKDAPKVKIVTTQQISPAATEVSAQVTALKQSNPQVVYIDTAEAYGPIWQAMQTAGMTNVKILTQAGAWYDSFSAMGPLEANAYAPFYTCAPNTDVVYPATVQDLMAQYSAATYAYSTNYRIYLTADTIPFLFLRYAIQKEHSDSPAAIKAAMNSMTNQSFDTVKYTFTPTNHFGIQGTDAAAVCKMAPPYAGGVGKIPIISTSASS